MAELADALVLGSSVHDVQVQVLLSAPYHVKPNVLIFDSAFGFLFSGQDSIAGSRTKPKWWRSGSRLRVFSEVSTQVLPNLLVSTEDVAFLVPT